MKLVVIGGGEHARVVIETARALGLEVEGFTDPQPCEETQRRLGVRWLGGDTVRDDVRYVLGVGAVGTGDLRARIVARYASAQFATLVHPRAWVSPTATLGDGTVVLAGAVIQIGARIGAHAVIGSSCVIEHDVTLGAFVQAGPGVILGGGVTVGEGAYLGLGARVRDHVAIGDRALVGMGAVVTTDVAPDTTVLGIPARPRS